jgi:hypothetical protein
MNETLNPDGADRSALAFVIVPAIVALAAKISIIAYLTATL